MYTKPVFLVNADGTPVADPIIDSGALGVVVERDGLVVSVSEIVISQR